MRPIETHPLRAAGFVAGALFLGACAAGSSTSTAPTNVPTLTSPAPAVTAASTPAAAPSTPSAPASPASAVATGSTAAEPASACTAGGPIPSGAATKTISDVDGDGRADTGFIYKAGNGTPVIGVRTAAGGTFVADFNSASGSDGRSVTFAAVSNTGPFVALTDDGRQSQLFVVHNCLLLAAQNAQGAGYQFDLRNFGGQGDGVTCGTVAGQGPPTLIGFHYTRNPDGKQTGTETRTAVVINASGSEVIATNGKSETLTGRPDPAGISCGAVTETKDAISLATR